ncbi:MAG: GMC oxidoreductase, partial [Methylococcaceae bacterium]|nr:GMC oxidoreductase [Methylococcaceae bacterium]
MPPVTRAPSESEIHCDYVVVGSGFGGSVSALRLAEKGYRVVVLEKGRRFRPRDFPKTNWDLPRWLWMPTLGFRGPFQMRVLRHIAAFTGVGVGGGSLVYGNTLPTPGEGFFRAPSWAHLSADWQADLAPHYETALRMLGAGTNRHLDTADVALGAVARKIGREAHFGPNRIGIFQGEPGKTVPDPYFGGEGPPRTGCIRCGACFLGCRHGAKNTLDKNYLWLAERRGLAIEADTEARWVKPLPGGGYEITALVGRSPFPFLRTKKIFTAKNVIFAGGVMGTVELLLKLKESPDGLPKVSDRLGDFVRTNSEVLMGVVSDSDEDLSKGIAIGSILRTDEHSHLEPVRYPSGSGFFRLLAMPHAPGDTIGERFAAALGMLLRHPWKSLKAWLTPDWAKHTMILLYMRTVEGTLRMKLGRGIRTGFRRGVTTGKGTGPQAKAWVPEATDLARRIEKRLGGFAQSLLTETLLGIPTTAHILGGCCMGDSPANGVIDHRHRVFGYEGLYVIDGSA